MGVISVIDADLSLTIDDKNEALEQELVLAAAGQNPTKQRMQKFARTALKILQATVAELETGLTQLAQALANFEYKCIA